MGRTIDIRSTVRSKSVASDLRHVPLRFCDPLLVYDGAVASGTETGPIHRSSGTVVRIRDKTCLIVNQHVIELYRRKLNAGERSTLEFLDQQIDFTRRVIDEDCDCDLAVLDISDLRLTRSEETTGDNVPALQEYVPPRFWPRSDLLEGDTVMFAGWPEVDADGDGAEGDFASCAFAAARIQVTRVSDERLSFRFDRTEWQSLWGTNGEGDHRRLRGLCGMPIFRDPGKAAREYELVGFVTEYNPELDVLYAVATTTMKSDGTFWH